MSIHETLNVFVRKGVVPEVQSIEAGLIHYLRDFYSNDQWIEKIRYFDAAYGKSSEEVFETFQNEIISLLP